MSGAEWHYVVDGKSVGPVTTEEISEKYRTAAISSDTLVWTDGMSDWQPLHEIEDFKNLTKKRTPPPIPGQYPAVPALPESAIKKIEIPEVEADNQLLSDNEKEQIELSSLRQSEPQIPWSRYFARILDMSVLGTIVITLSLILSPYASIPLYLKIYTADPRLLMIIALPLVMIVNGIIITIFGNSLGKKIFGIHVVNVQAKKPFTLLENVARELRVWVRGLALGLPIFSFFTLIPECNRVSKGKPTSYDEGIASVRPYSNNPWRRAFGIILTIIVLSLIIGSNNIEKQNFSRMSQPHDWINPKTNISVTIPSNWESDTTPAPGTSDILYTFTNLNTGVVVLMGVETFDEMTISRYSKGLVQVLSKTMNFDSEWTETTIPGVWHRTATIIDGKHPAELFLTQVGSSYWRVVYVDQTSKNRNVNSPELTKALFQSAGVR